jgi:hypothetical protein
MPKLCHLHWPWFLHLHAHSLQAQYFTISFFFLFCHPARACNTSSKSRLSLIYMRQWSLSLLSPLPVPWPGLLSILIPLSSPFTALPSLPSSSGLHWHRQSHNCSHGSFGLDSRQPCFFQHHPSCWSKGFSTLPPSWQRLTSPAQAPNAALPSSFKILLNH